MKATPPPLGSGVRAFLCVRASFEGFWGASPEAESVTGVVCELTARAGRSGARAVTSAALLEDICGLIMLLIAFGQISGNMATEHVNGNGTEEPMDTSAAVTHSEHFQTLLDAGLPQKVAEKLDEIYVAGKV